MITDLHQAVRRYRLDLGWVTTVSGTQLAVHLDRELGGLELSHDLAVELVNRLRANGFDCPVVAVPARMGPRCVLLFRPDRPAALPAGVRMLPSGDTVPLPPSVVPGGEVRWVSPPRPDTAALPSLPMLADLIGRVAQRPDRLSA